MKPKWYMVRESWIRPEVLMVTVLVYGVAAFVEMVWKLGDSDQIMGLYLVALLTFLGVIYLPRYKK